VPGGSGAALAANPAVADQELIEGLLQGNEAAFEALVSRYHGSLLRVALVFVGDRAVAEEVVQDTWVAVLNGLRSFEGRSSLKTWLFAILSNRARTRAVREQRSIPFSALADPETGEEPAVESSRFTTEGMWAVPPGSWGADNPEEQLLRQETMAVLYGAMAELPAQQRAVVTLRDVEGLNSDEVCDALQVSEANQRVLLHRARSRLRAVLERYFNTKMR
jgi:RNA polymerase sigma-70 factor (ECF subfamily)